MNVSAHTNTELRYLCFISRYLVTIFERCGDEAEDELAVAVLLDLRAGDAPRAGPGVRKTPPAPEPPPP